MIEARTRICFLLVILFLAGFAGQTIQFVYGSGSLQISSLPTDSPEVKTFIIEVSHHGFNHTSGKLAVTVNEGDRVRLVFRYADLDLQSGNPHVIYLSGYNLESTVIDAANPEAVLEFTAGQIGEFNFYCAIPCAGMSDLQLGYLVVVPSSTSKMETHMTLSAVLVGTEENELTIRARITGHDEKPVAGIVVTFQVNTTFGPMVIGTAVTDNNGIASINYDGPLHETVEIIAVFPGSGSFDRSAATVTLTIEARRIERESAGLPYSLGQNALPDIRAVGVPFYPALGIFVVLGLIVGSIWSIYALVVYQLLSIWRGEKYGKATSPYASDFFPTPFAGFTRGFAFWVALAVCGAATGLAVSFLLPASTLRLTGTVLVVLIETALVQVLTLRKRPARSAS